MIDEAIILAGGLGTRLRGVIGDLPKPLAPVGEKPFLIYLLDFLVFYNIKYTVIASGFMHDAMEKLIGKKHGKLNIIYSPEKEPLGTGGAVLNAIEQIKGDDFFILNGDTYFDVSLHELEQSYRRNKAVMSLAVKYMDVTSRYGSIIIEDDTIVAFREKETSPDGFINGGIYVLNKEWFSASAPGKKFSLEKDILEKLAGKSKITAYPSDGYFIDIGVPEDYLKACSELPGLRHVRR